MLRVASGYRRRPRRGSTRHPDDLRNYFRILEYFQPIQTYKYIRLFYLQLMNRYIRILTFDYKTTIVFM
ncbi:UNVERIFIED_ORG: hypothetical protein FNL38_1202 [Nocardia globerula]|uniref:Uncharacterized protein n=1 Tax=Nocardia globerula TaxID=1818 RepID=A0A652YGP8_NOCGL